MMKRNRKNIKRKKANFFIIFIIICFFVVLGVLFHYGKIRIPKELASIVNLSNTDSSSEGNNKDFLSDFDYYHSNSSVIAEYDVCESKNIKSESEVYERFRSRGFGDCDITTEYEINGEWHENNVVSESSSEIHPLYQTFYISSKGDAWVIFDINGSIIANPIFYNIQENLEKQLVVSESEIINSYSNSENKFYETIPNETELNVMVIDRIDNNSLDSLAEKIMDGL